MIGHQRLRKDLYCYKIKEIKGYIMGKKIEKEEAFKIFRQYKLEPIGEYTNSTTSVKCIDVNGYYVKIALDDVKLGKKGKVFSKYNHYTNDNIKRFIDIDTNSEYEYVAGTFENAYSVFSIRHKKCGRIFMSKWCNIHRKPSKKEPNRHGTRCPFCEATQLESTHALVLKQVWLHEKDGTVVEDMSCINPNTNCPLPTDIVNHEDKIAIEVQSWFHDFDKQKVKDKIKKEYWEGIGYKFYAVDQRDYTVVDMIKIFFPHINSIPDYIDFGYANKLDDVKVQVGLNAGKSVSEIAKEIGCKPHTIYDAIRYGRISYPEDYQKRYYTPVIQLSLSGDYIREYETIKEAQEQTGLKYIQPALYRENNRCGDYLWILKSVYYK